MWNKFMGKKKSADAISTSVSSPTGGDVPPRYRPPAHAGVTGTSSPAGRHRRHPPLRAVFATADDAQDGVDGEFVEDSEPPSSFTTSSTPPGGGAIANNGRGGCVVRVLVGDVDVSPPPSGDEEDDDDGDIGGSADVDDDENEVGEFVF
jgi:hypothetical protein